MTLSTRLKNFMSRPPIERRSRLRAAWRVTLATLLFCRLGTFVNRAGSHFLIVYRPDFDYDLARFPEFDNLHRWWKARVCNTNGGDLNRMYLLWLNVGQVLKEGVLGDLIEVGVYKGNSAKILQILAAQNRRSLYLFDTFAGFDKIDTVGVDAASIGHPGFKDTSFEAVRAFVGTENTYYVPGYFPQSTESVELPARISVLHVDCDLYAPTKAALEVFYERLSPGGLIILHDFGSGHWPGTTKAVEEFFANKPEHVVIMPDKSGTAVVRRAS